VEGSYSSVENDYKKINNQGLNSIITFQINTRDLNKNKIILFFDKYLLLTVKSLDFSEWKKLIELTEIKHYKSYEGRNENLAISKNMNNRRNFDLIENEIENENE